MELLKWRGMYCKYVYLSMVCVSQKYFERKKAVYILFQKKYGPCIKRKKKYYKLLQVSRSNDSKLKHIFDMIHILINSWKTCISNPFSIQIVWIAIAFEIFLFFSVYLFMMSYLNVISSRKYLNCLRYIPCLIFILVYELYLGFIFL